MAGILVLVVDRWGAAWCGPYGNTFVDTPAVNTLASQSLLVEWMMAQSPELNAAYASYWRGGDDSAPSLPAIANAQGWATTLVTDEPALSGIAAASDFGECWLQDKSPSDHLARSIARTRSAELLAIAAEKLERSEAPQLLWVHAQGMQGPWDAPWKERLKFVEQDDDPEPSQSPIPPQRNLAPDDDPDIAFGAMQCYAAQVQVIDACLDVLLESLPSSAPQRQPWVILTSPRGYPLGEHLRIGPCDEALYGELLHVPLMIRPPGGLTIPRRCPVILQPDDLGNWLAGLLRQDQDHAEALRQLTQLARPSALARYGRQMALRTPSWYARRAEKGVLELYVKPDDRWEANEISQRCPEEAEKLRQVLEIVTEEQS